MKKILYVVSTLRRLGPTNVLYNLISKLDRSKFYPVILTLSPEDPNHHSLEHDFELLEVEIHKLNLSRIEGFFWATSKIFNFVKSNKIDIVHINGFRGDWLTRRNKNNKLKIVTTINSNIFDDYTMLYGKIYGRIMASLHISAIRKKDAVGCSKFVAKQVNDRYGADLKVIYNGIPKESYQPATTEEKLKLREELALPIPSTIFLFVGLLIYRKDPVTVIKAFIESQSKSNSTMIIIGDGPLMQECKTAAKDSKNIIFLGNRPETLNYLRASDFYIASSFSEGLPTSVMEAMGCGIPVILSDIDPHKELVADIISWPYTFPTSDYITLAKKMDLILKEDYNKLRRECRNVIENQINATIMASKYEQLYLSEI
ncbi:glycosyltransferase family 4 protein [Dyadobacter psychrotolerans]|uniref:Glycosyltransferase n=1 Tax=Dyadobacter psychrotolerans TaxID=2541721 RepID=A0A4R5DGL4_9BACT|nr:glycosyltransferase family 4 protein [Dyadobacter psychrotolerans]TDE13136.1 glycosyltransferase [Dyadobacter psychrotolerans]